MRCWNMGDERLIRLLRDDIHDADAEFEVGSEGGVAVYGGARFLGVWIECQRGLHCYVPAARLQPTLIHLLPDQVVVATRSILENARNQWRRLRSTA